MSKPYQPQPGFEYQMAPTKPDGNGWSLTEDGPVIECVAVGGGTEMWRQWERPAQKPNA